MPFGARSPRATVSTAPSLARMRTTALVFAVEAGLTAADVFTPGECALRSLDARVAGDIGCYTLAAVEPLKAIDLILCTLGAGALSRADSTRGTTPGARATARR